MTDYIFDEKSGEWVLISPRNTALSDLQFKEAFRVGEDGESPSWKVLVLEEKDPVTDFQEIIIHSQKKEKQLHELEDEEIKQVFHTFKDRYDYYHQMGQVIIYSDDKYFSRASKNYSCSRLIVIPHRIKMNLLEVQSVHNIILESDNFTAFCPNFSQNPYEVIISPKKEDTVFSDIKENELAEISSIYKQIMQALAQISKEKYSLEKFNFHFYISPKDNWFLRIIPDFEPSHLSDLNIGISLNRVEPKEASEIILEKIKKITNYKLPISGGKSKGSSNQSEVGDIGKEPSSNKIKKEKTTEEKMEDLMGKLNSF